MTFVPPPALQKTGFKDQIMVSNLTSGVYKFQLTVTDSIGQSDSIKVTVLVLTPEQSEREYPDRGGKLPEASDSTQMSHEFSFFSTV